MISWAPPSALYSDISEHFSHVKIEIFLKFGYMYCFILYAILLRRKVKPKLNDFNDEPLILPLLTDGAEISEILSFMYFWDQAVLYIKIVKFPLRQQFCL